MVKTKWLGRFHLTAEFYIFKEVIIFSGPYIRYYRKDKNGVRAIMVGLAIWPLMWEFGISHYAKMLVLLKK